MRIIRCSFAFFIAGNLDGLVKKRITKNLAASVLVHRLRTDPKLANHAGKIERNVIWLVLSQRFPRNRIPVQVTGLSNTHLFNQKWHVRLKLT